jgi:hypothetical protein
MRMLASVLCRCLRLPIPAGVRDSSAISLRQIATEKSADHGSASAKNHEEDAGGDRPRKVREQEDENASIHQNRQNNSYEALRHTYLLARSMEPKELTIPDLIFPIPSVLYGRQAGW